MAHAPRFCPQRQHLLEQFVIAAQEQIDLQNAQLNAFIHGEGFPLEPEIADARERRDQTKYAVLAHEELHGCS
jgi:hypothetical protein